MRTHRRTLLAALAAFLLLIAVAVTAAVSGFPGSSTSRDPDPRLRAGAAADTRESDEGGEGACVEGGSEDGSEGELRANPEQDAAGTAETGEREPGEDEAGEGEETCEENEAENIRQRFRWFYHRRTDLHGRVQARSYLAARRQANQLRAGSAAAAPSAPLTFSELGPHAIGGTIPWTWGGAKPYAGRVTAIATSPVNSSVAYIGTSNGGVWKTTNGGSNWAPMTDRLPSLAIGAVTVDRSNPETVYVGTGESDLCCASYLGAGIFKSTDGGGHWTKLAGTTFDTCHISGIKVAPGNPNLVVVAAHGRGASQWESWSSFCAGHEGVWRSLNGGSTFTRTLQTGVFSDLAVAPNNGNVWFVGVAGNGIWKSADGAGTWTKLAGGLPTSGFYRVDFDVAASPTGPTQVLYAAFSRSTDQHLTGFFRSNDGGNNWTSQPTFNTCGTGTDADGNPKGQCLYDLTVAVNPTNPDRAYLGGVFLDRYTAGTVARLGNGTDANVGASNGIHADFHASAFDAAGRLWVGSDGGVYRTSDGLTFSNLNADLGNILVYPGISGRFAGPLYAGAQDNGAFRYSGTPTWSQVSLGDGFFTATDPAVPDPAYTESQYANIVKHTGSTSCAASTPDVVKDVSPFNAPLVMHPGNRNVLYSAGNHRIWRATNAALTGCSTALNWQLTSPTLNGAVTTIAPAPSNTSVVYASTAGSRGLWVNTGSTTWTNTIANGLPAATVTDIAVSPTSPSTAWAALGNFGAFGHLWRTTNSGGTWTDVSGNLPNAPISAVAVDSRTSPSTLYVGTDVGVFWSTDGGATWANTSVALPNAVISDVLLDKAANQLVVATYGRGIWAAPLPRDAVPGDAFASASPVGPLPYTQVGLSNTAAGADEPGEVTSCGPMGKTLWWKYSPTSTGSVTVDTVGSNFDTVLAVYEGAALNALTRVGCDDDGGGGGAGSVSAVTVNATGGQTYYLQVGGFKDAAGAVDTGSVSVHVTGAAPANESFAAASPVGSVPFSQADLSNTRARGDEAGEDTTCGPMGKTLWWTYTPAANERVVADTVGSNFDTVLAIHQGTALGGLTRVGCDDDGGGGGTGSVSAATVNLTGGQKYYFQVGGFKDAAGGVGTGSITFRLNRAALANDSFAGAQSATSLPFAAGPLPTGFAGEAGEPVPSCAPIGKTLWWRFTPSTNMQVTADTAGSGFDTVLAVYRGTALDALTQTGCDDDGGGAGSTSVATVALTAGQTYYFQAGGYKASAADIKSGNLRFRLASP